MEINVYKIQVAYPWTECSKTIGKVDTLGEVFTFLESWCKEHNHSIGLVDFTSNLMHGDKVYHLLHVVARSNDRDHRRNARFTIEPNFLVV